MAETEKVSVTIDKIELRRARLLARRVGENFSSFVTAAVRDYGLELERQLAAERIVATFAPEERATPAETVALLALWSRPRVVRKKKPVSARVVARRR